MELRSAPRVVFPTAVHWELQLTKERTMKVKFAVPAMALAAMLLAACNTIDGVGKDVEAAGEGIQEGSEAVEEDIKD
jgi:predicted small secreted protein